MTVVVRCKVCGGILRQLTPRLWDHERADLIRFGLHKAKPDNA